MYRLFIVMFLFTIFLIFLSFYTITEKFSNKSIEAKTRQCEIFMIDDPLQCKLLKNTFKLGKIQLNVLKQKLEKYEMYKHLTYYIDEVLKSKNNKSCSLHLENVKEIHSVNDEIY